MRSNTNNIIKLKVLPTEQQTGENEKQPKDYVNIPLFISFQRLYMCHDACKIIFQVCRPIIGLNGCFINDHYGW